MDVLERGEQSPYYRYFDIDWDHWHPELKGKVVVPFLGDELAKCIREGQIKIGFSQDGFTVNYSDTPYPLSLSGYPFLISIMQSGMKDDPVPGILSKMVAVAEGIDYDTWLSTKRGYIEAVRQLPTQLQSIEKLLSTINQDRSLLQRLLDQQFYSLSFWKDTDEKINYRRFFTVNELICLRMEDENVFDEYHRYLFKLHREKLFDGFRIDHIDGLQDQERLFSFC